ncbi:MAG: hypothetical protein IIU83_06675 [Fibrobacteraceae bacterium]|nr:hypothetical protein [Fibrobacteraceae bacterium]
MNVWRVGIGKSWLPMLLIKNIYIAPVPQECAHSEGELFGVYKNIKNKYPDCKCVIEFDEERLPGQLPQGKKIKDISIEMTKTSDIFGKVLIGFERHPMYDDFMCYVFINFNEGNPLILKNTCYCDGLQTMKNLDEFIEKFPERLEVFEKQFLEIEKKQKLLEVRKRSIQATVEQVLSATSYTWNLLDKSKGFDLIVHIGSQNAVKVGLDGRNFMKRMRLLQETLMQVETFLDSLKIPVEILMKK